MEADNGKMAFGVEDSMMRALTKAAVFSMLLLSSCASRAPELEPIAPVPIGRVALVPTASTRASNAPSFLHRAPQVGDRVRVKTATHSQSSIVDAPPEGEIYKSDYELVVSKVAGDAITEASVVFTMNERAPWSGANDDFNYAPKSTALAGQHLRIVSEPLSVTTESGAPVAADVSESALNAISDIGMRNAMDAAIADRPYLPGDHADDLAPALVRMLNPRSWHFLSGFATLKFIDDASGIFHVAIKVHSDSKYDIEFEGDMTVRRSDRLVSDVTLKGKFSRDDLSGTIAYARTAE